MARIVVCGIDENNQKFAPDVVRAARGDPRWVLSRWRRVHFTPLYILAADEDVLPLIPRRVRALLDAGQYPVLDYRLLQSLVSRRPDLVLATITSEGQQSGSGEGEAKSGSQNQEHGQNQAAFHQPRVPTHLRRLAQRGRRRGRKRVGGMGGNSRTKITLTYLPEPNPDDVVRVQRMFQRLVDRSRALDDSAAFEAFPRRFNWRKLAVRGRTAQVARARRWEKVGAMPQVLLALDTSGSMSAYVSDLLALGMAVSRAVPDVLIMDAWNGLYGAPLAVVDGYPVAAVWQGKLWSLDALRDAGHPMPEETSDDQATYQAWSWVASHFKVRLGVFLSDWEDLNIIPGLIAGGVKQAWVLSNEYSSWMYPALDASNWRDAYPNDVARFVQRVVGCGSMDDFFTALEMLLA